MTIAEMTRAAILVEVLSVRKVAREHYLSVDYRSACDGFHRLKIGSALATEMCSHVADLGNDAQMLFGSYPPRPRGLIETHGAMVVWNGLGAYAVVLVLRRKACRSARGFC